eukprot:gene34579-64815_t
MAATPQQTRGAAGGGGGTQEAARTPWTWTWPPPDRCSLGASHTDTTPGVNAAGVWKRRRAADLDADCVAAAIDGWYTEAAAGDFCGRRAILFAGVCQMLRADVAAMGTGIARQD